MLKILIKFDKFQDNSYKNVIKRRENIKKMIIFFKKNIKAIKFLLKLIKNIIKEFHEYYLNYLIRSFIMLKKNLLMHLYSGK